MASKLWRRMKYRVCASYGVGLGSFEVGVAASVAAAVKRARAWKSSVAWVEEAGRPARKRG